MGAQGSATIDFGAFPGKTDASVAVTGQTSILSGSLVEAWVSPVATSDHSADEHVFESMRVIAGNVVAGTGFTIYAVKLGDLLGTDQNFLYGQWTVNWCWN